MSLRAYAAFAGLLAAFAAGWAGNGWRLQADHRAEALERSRQALRLIDQRDELAGRLAASNDRHAGELRKAQNETNRLRDCLRAGTCGLRVVATLPAACPGVPEAAPGTGVDPAAGAELAEPARRAYFALRDGIDLASAQLAACQAELKLRASPAE